MTAIAGNAITAPLTVIFTVNDGLITRAFDGLSEDALWHRASENSNPMFWLLGHVVHTRNAVLRLVGDDYRTGWGDLFRRGAALESRDRYPALAEIHRVRSEVMSRLPSRLAAASDELLSRPATLPLPASKTIADQLGFLAMHDSYHVGQMGFIRKLLGYPGIAG